MIPFFKPTELNHLEVQQLKNSLDRLLTSGMLTDGECCRLLEDEVRRLYKVDYAFVAPNGTAALDVLVKIINPRVIYSPAFTWKSLLTVFDRREVIWLDVSTRSWLSFVPGSALRKDMLVLYNHTFGNVGEAGVLGSHMIVYDGAHAFGAKIKDFGDATVFSFAPSKPMTTGEGGMIVTNNDKLAKLIQAQQHVLLRMSEFNAAVGLGYLQKLPEVLKKRRVIWRYYNKHLPFPHQEVPVSHSCSVYGILVSERDELIRKIQDKMQYRVHYEPIHRGLQATEWVFKRILCIPSYVGCPYKEIVELLTDV